MNYPEASILTSRLSSCTSSISKVLASVASARKKDEKEFNKYSCTKLMNFSATFYRAFLFPTISSTTEFQETSSLHKPGKFPRRANLPKALITFLRSTKT
ncbi:hypothetical protein Mapa_010420 [Marchantia paleacea]|nr:hypothetical protein Mapa_010420 [Marchantia paleacea]